MLLDEIKKLIRGEIQDNSVTLKKYSRDASIFEIQPQLVIFPKNSDDIIKLVKFVNAHPNQNLSLTCRAAGTDMTGGAINDSIIVDLSHLNHIIKMGNNSAKTQPGVFYRDFEKETLKKNLLLPSYTSSKDICSVGGMVANNAAGEKSLAYGQTKDYVKSLKVVLSDGNEYKFYSLTKEQLRQKVTQNNFEGQIYQQVWGLIKENHHLIASAAPQTSKNSTGYLLWEVYDGQSIDFGKLFVGSQGTLGIITEIEFKLISPKPYSYTLVILLDDLKTLDKIIKQVLNFKPESFECFDDKTLEAASKLMPEQTKELSLDQPALVLLAEFTADTNSEALEKSQKCQQSLATQNIRVLKSSEAGHFWDIRRKSFGLLSKHNQSMSASPFIDDIIVNPNHLSEFLPRLDSILDQYKRKIIYTMAGHIGNGNFHIIPLMNLTDPEIKKIIPKLMEKVFNLVFEYQGSMSAEHNDGLVRGPFLEKMYGEKMFGIFQQVKQIFDPNNIFNPHKKTDSSAKYSFLHLIKR